MSPPGRPPAPQGDGLELEYEMVLTNGDSFRTRHFSAEELGAAAAGGERQWEVGWSASRSGVYWGLWGSEGVYWGLGG